jgi:hypothetical protein
MLTLWSSMVGALNKLPVAASGMVFFGDPVSFGSVTAVMVGFLAGVLYAIAKTNQAKLGMFTYSRNSLFRFFRNSSDSRVWKAAVGQASNRPQ